MDKKLIVRGSILLIVSFFFALAGSMLETGPVFWLGVMSVLTAIGGVFALGAGVFHDLND